jgi:hypothetical protein
MNKDINDSVSDISAGLQRVTKDDYTGSVGN